MKQLKSNQKILFFQVIVRIYNIYIYIYIELLMIIINKMNE